MVLFEPLISFFFFFQCITFLDCKFIFLSSSSIFELKNHVCQEANNHKGYVPNDLLDYCDCNGGIYNHYKHFKVTYSKQKLNQIESTTLA
jgi:hypothetical protein